MSGLSPGKFQEKYWGSWDQVETFRHRAARDLVRNGPVLDIGAGDGFFLSLLKTSGVKGVGVDLSEIGARKAAEKGLDVRVADLASGSLPFEDRSFETVVLLDVLEHFFEPGAALKEAVRISRRDVIISVPNFSSLPARLQVLIGRVPENNTQRKGHVYWFNWRTLKMMMQDAGLEIEACRFNANASSRPLLGKLFAKLAYRWPSLFALSFVVRAEGR